MENSLTFLTKSMLDIRCYVEDVMFFYHFGIECLKEDIWKKVFLPFLKLKYWILNILILAKYCSKEVFSF